jgi:integrase/recombinase XerC
VPHMPTFGHPENGVRVSAPTISTLTLSEAGRIIREAMRDESYRLLPMGAEVEAYMRVKRKQLTKGSERKYRAALAELALHFPDLELKDFEPPVGTERLEEFMDARYGHLAPRTYNSCLSAVKDFFKWQAARGYLYGDPALPITRAKARDAHRETFTGDQVRAIVASQDELRDRLALRLLLNYALRKSELRAVQFKHFDHVRRRLTVFGKGGTVTAVPVPDPAFWHDLERLILDTSARPGDYLLCGRRGNRHGTRLLPDVQMGVHGLHDWWYARLADAGVVATGTTSGERMHKARHTAGQALLDASGNLKAVQKLLRHKSMLTTADVYVDWDLDQLAQSLADALREDG